MTRGIVLGRFLPLHNGHVALIRTARALVDHLTIVVCWQPGDDPAGVTRLQWMLEMFPSVRVVGLQAPSPKTAAESDAKCAEWRAKLQELHPEPIDTVFASEIEQECLARTTSARFVLIDPAHEAVPVASADVRARPLDHWRFLPPAARPAFVRTICLHGPESTGKSHVALALARHYSTLHVPEYGRTYCEQFGRTLGMSDLVTIGKTHSAMTQALIRQCNSRLIVDTDPLMTAVWADMLLGARDPWFDAFDATADLYLLFDIDTPFVDDGVRFFGEPVDRRRFFDLSLSELRRRGVAYRIIGGPIEERFDRALEAIADSEG